VNLADTVAVITGVVVTYTRSKDEAEELVAERRRGWARTSHEDP
jgi:hypothetical protein